MANHIQRRTRSERVASIELPPGLLERTWEYLHRGDVLLRLTLCLLTAIALWAITGAWAPPFSFRKDYTPRRDIVARAPFKVLDVQATKEAHERAKRRVRFVYDLDKEPLVQLRARLNNRVKVVLGAATWAEVDRKAWDEFFAPPLEPPPPAATEAELEARKASEAMRKEEHFLRFREALQDPENLRKFEEAVAQAMRPIEQRGLIHDLPPDAAEGNQQEIVVQHPKETPKQSMIVRVSDVLIGEAETLRRNLYDQLENQVVAARVFDWLRPQLPDTLVINREARARAEKAAESQVKDVYAEFLEGSLIAKAGKPLTQESLDLLRLEYSTMLGRMSSSDKFNYSLASLGMYIALSTICGVYVLCYERRLLQSLRRFVTMLAVVLVTVGLALIASQDSWRAELIPLLLFGMTLAIAYHQELALLISAAVALVIVVAIGQDLREFVVLTAGAATAIMLVGQIRSRRKLIYVGLCVSAVTFLTTIGVSTLAEQPLLETTLPDAIRFGLWSLIAGFLMTGLLPFIESLFGVQTELSLLELGDIAHPLLQELARRAPGTYNHSINVASIAESAAEAIGAKGLLVRVGAYFHDIGKMLKPGYFVENQGQDGNRHETLVPAMSTLIIIAHIKDGADLARQHHLPDSIIDLIQQHHGTTLVEYFYRRASQISETNPYAPEVEESSFRYPGPKPQSKEAAVLMVADAVESACRALVEPTPSRIENLVHDMAMKRLLDGQFDECGLTLQELARVEDSLVKSLTAVYHGRVKYPDQRTERTA